MQIEIKKPSGQVGLVELSEPHAWALAELCKRITFADCRSNAIDDEEAHQMIAATDKLGEALAKAGYATR